MAGTREYTDAECRALLINHVRGIVNYWEKEIAGNLVGVREALNGLAFSLLATLDGKSGELPAFDLVAVPHQDDMEFCKRNNENWWPQNRNITDGVDLHDLYYAE